MPGRVPASGEKHPNTPRLCPLVTAASLMLKKKPGGLILVFQPFL